MGDDVKAYVVSCGKCQMVETGHKPTEMGELEPTVPPHVHHTWYADFKGPMPNGTGYLLAVVEGVSPFTRLRHVKAVTGKEAIAALDDCIACFGTRPKVLRTDGGQPFDSTEFKTWAQEEGITVIVGVPHHLQGQGMVETRFRGIASAIIATLGANAPADWAKGGLLIKLENVIITTVVMPIAGSPSWVLTDREPRMRLSAATDFDDQDYGEHVLGMAGLPADDLMNIIVQHHDRIAAVQGRVAIATSVAQALTKRVHDASRERGDFKVGDWVITLCAAPNRLMPHYQGPYKLASVTDSGNFVTMRHFLADKPTAEKLHVSRLLHFDFTRATAVELTQWQLTAGNDVIAEVIGDRALTSEAYEFELRWFNYPVTTWLEGAGVTKNKLVIYYCLAKGIPLPGKAKLTKASAPAVVLGRGQRAASRIRKRGGGHGH